MLFEMHDGVYIATKCFSSQCQWLLSRMLGCSTKHLQSVPVGIVVFDLYQSQLTLVGKTYSYLDYLSTMNDEKSWQGSEQL